MVMYCVLRNPYMCDIFSQTCVVTASLAVLLAEIHLPALVVVGNSSRALHRQEQLNLQRSIYSGGHNLSSSQARRRYQIIIIRNIIY
jgi:hypothetical protein